MYAQGGEEGSATQRGHRLVGAWEFSKRILTSTSLGRYTLALGDFNSIPSSAALELIYSQTGLKDAWSATHDSSFLPGATSAHSAHHAVTDLGVTADSPLNSYSQGKVRFF